MVADMLSPFVPKIVPPVPDRFLVVGRKQEIRKAVENAGLEVVSMFESGSFAHGTGVKDKSDVDVMIWTSYKQQTKLPSSILNRYKEALSVLNAREVRISNPVVRVSFWSGPAFEVAPAFYSSEKSGANVYHIGGRRDEWVDSAPSAHKSFVSSQNDRLSKRVKPLIRLVKAWKYHTGAPVSSFYLEMRVAEYTKSQSSIVYSIDLPAIFRILVDHEFRDMNDPEGLVGRIPATASDEKRRSAVVEARRALTNLTAAEAARSSGRAGDYWIAMARVFGDGFPWPA